MVGTWSCFTFGLVLCYLLGVFAFFTGYFIQSMVRRRRQKKSERLALSAEAASVTGALVGAGSLQQQDGTESTETTTHSESRRNLGRGASLLEPIDSLQPKQYKLNTHLRKGCYSLGFACASHPWLTFALSFAIIGILNLGWKNFQVETDPVRLWVETPERVLRRAFRAILQDGADFHHRCYWERTCYDLPSSTMVARGRERHSHAALRAPWL
jgi:Niemann-Pick C1 protein